MALGTDQETWADAPGYAGRYSVSTEARVWSHLSGDYRALVIGTHGYWQVTLTGADGRKRTHTVHELVAGAFLGQRPDGHEVRHRDGDGLNCCRVNLEYGTSADNTADAVRHGTYVAPTQDHQRAKVRCPGGHLLAEPNIRASFRTAGKRACLACNRATATVSNAKAKGIVLVKALVSDEHYRKIMPMTLDPSWVGWR
jgi:hypothetical protein